jgi:MFS family permease
MSTRGFTEKQYGDVVAINGMLIVLAQLPITAVSTRFPRGAMLMAAAILTGGGFALTGLARVQWHFGLVTVVWTIGEMIQAPLMSAIVGDLAPATMRARYMGVLSMSFSAAVAIGSPLGGWVLANHGGAPLWGACLVLGCIAAGMFAMIYRKVGPRGAVTT